METKYYLEIGDDCLPEEAAAFLEKRRIVTAACEHLCKDGVKRKLHIITLVQLGEIILVQNLPHPSYGFYKSSDEGPDVLLSLTEEEVREAINPKHFLASIDVIGVTTELPVEKVEILCAPRNHKKSSSEPFLFLPPKAKHPPLKMVATRARKP